MCLATSANGTFRTCRVALTMFVDGGQSGHPLQGRDFQF